MDPDGISNFIIKCIPESGRAKLLKIFNIILRERKFPSEWKASTVTMLAKSTGAKNSVSGYRPISLTACLARLLERLILARLQRHLLKHNVILNTQSGFRAHRSTQDNLSFTSQKISEAISEKNKTLAVMFDIASAFDRVWHNGLLYKLASIKTPLYLLELIADFLKNRTFCVKIGLFISAKYPITCGVPQGAVMSPTLFSIYINDVSGRYDNKKGQYSLLYADDLIFLAKFRKNVLLVERNTNIYLKELENWSKLWRLKFSPHKCSYTVFSSTKTGSNFEMNLQIYNTILLHDKTPKFLGYMYDSNLSGKSHIGKIKKTCISRLNIIRILTHKNWGLKYDTLVQIYKSIIRSIIEYSGLNYDSLRTNQKRELETIQNNALRAV